MSSKVERCSMYQRYVVLLTTRSSNTVFAMCVLRGFDELAVGRGQDGRAVEQYDAAIKEAQEMSRSLRSYPGAVEVWGHPYPCNGGNDPLPERLLCVKTSVTEPCKSQTVLDFEAALEHGPKSPCNRDSGM